MKTNSSELQHENEFNEDQSKGNIKKEGRRI